MVYRSSMSIQPIWIKWPVLITYCACLIPYLSSVSGKVFVNLQLIEYWDCFLTILIWNAIADYIVYMLIIKLVLSCEQSCDIYFSLHPPGVTLQLLTAVWCEIQGFTGKAEIKSREKQWVFLCLHISLSLSMETDEHLTLSVLIFFCNNLRKLKDMWIFIYAYGTKLWKQQYHIYKMYKDTGTRTDFCSTFRFTSVVPSHSDRGRLLLL